MHVVKAEFNGWDHDVAAFTHICMTLTYINIPDEVGYHNQHLNEAYPGRVARVQPGTTAFSVSGMIAVQYLTAGQEKIDFDIVLRTYGKGCRHMRLQHKRFAHTDHLRQTFLRKKYLPRRISLSVSGS